MESSPGRGPRAHTRLSDEKRVCYKYRGHNFFHMNRERHGCQIGGGGSRQRRGHRDGPTDHNDAKPPGPDHRDRSARTLARRMR